MMRRRDILLPALFLLLPGLPACCQMVEWHGQASSWITAQDGPGSLLSGGIRYIPSLYGKKNLSSSWTLDAETSVNGFISLQNQDDDPRAEQTWKTYRLWLRLSSRQMELRAGLQRIDFGPASLIRSLMWFDRLDPRDPLRLTDGVYGLLFRYYFLDNSTIWLWGLLGNGGMKGWEMIPGPEDRPEYGMRIQIPAAGGEAAFSAHHRDADLQKGLLGIVPLGTGMSPEDRFALDGRWDIGAGIWFEAVITKRNTPMPALNRQRQVTAGIDYTFGLGNGLTFLAEQYHLACGAAWDEAASFFDMTALSLTYPLGLLDRCTAMVYRDWTTKGWFRFISLQRMLDRWSFFLMGFWNPSRFPGIGGLPGADAFSGRGIQAMVVFNH